MNTRPGDVSVAPSDNNPGNITYGPYVGAILFGPLALATLVIDYVKRKDACGTALESHFNWQIRTFKFSLPWLIVGAVRWLVIIG